MRGRQRRRLDGQRSPEIPAMAPVCVDRYETFHDERSQQKPPVLHKKCLYTALAPIRNGAPWNANDVTARCRPMKRSIASCSIAGGIWGTKPARRRYPGDGSSRCHVTAAGVSSIARDSRAKILSISFAAPSAGRMFIMPSIASNTPAKEPTNAARHAARPSRPSGPTRSSVAPGASKTRTEKRDGPLRSKAPRNNAPRANSRARPVTETPSVASPASIDTTVIIGGGRPLASRAAYETRSLPASDPSGGQH